MTQEKSNKSEKQYRNISEACKLPDFYPDLPQEDFKSLQNKYLMIDARIEPDFSTGYGTRDATRICFETIPGDPTSRFTTFSSAKAVVDEVKRAKKARIIPCMVNIQMKQSQDGNNYYTLNGSD